MRSLIIAGVSALALTMGGAAFAQNAQSNGMTGNEPAQSTTPHTGAMHHKHMASKSDVKMAQQKLKSQGLYKGKVDGESGPETMAALKHFQKQNNLKATGKLDHATKEKLGLAMNSGSSAAPEGSNAGEGSSTSPNAATTSHPTAPPSITGGKSSGNSGAQHY